MIEAILRLYTFFLGFAYPGYASYKAIESASKSDDTQWLTYWVVYAFLLIGESLSEYMLVWIPGYRYVKCALIFWLASPRFKGAAVLYDKVVKDALKKAEPHVDKICALVAKGDVGGVRKEVGPALEAVKGLTASLTGKKAAPPVADEKKAE